MGFVTSLMMTMIMMVGTTPLKSTAAPTQQTLIPPHQTQMVMGFVIFSMKLTTTYLRRDMNLEIIAKTQNQWSAQPTCAGTVQTEIHRIALAHPSQVMVYLGLRVHSSSQQSQGH